MIEIRAALPGDDRALGEVDAATWTAAVSPAPAPPAGRPFFTERTRPHDVLVAEVEGSVVAYAELRQPTALAAHAHVLELGGLAVHPAHQRGGIGRSLLDAAVVAARKRGARKLSLRVLSTNLAARRCYEANGFVVEGILRAEFRLDGSYVDDVLMARHLVPAPHAAA